MRMSRPLQRKRSAASCFTRERFTPGWFLTQKPAIHHITWCYFPGRSPETGNNRWTGRNRSAGISPQGRSRPFCVRSLIGCLSLHGTGLESSTRPTMPGFRTSTMAARTTAVRTMRRGHAPSAELPIHPFNNLTRRSRVLLLGVGNDQQATDKRAGRDSVSRREN